MFDPSSRRGWTLGFLDASPCGNHPNDRELCFTLDAATTPEWTDLGRPSAATIMVAALAVLDGALYAATWEGPPSERGHVYRLGPGGWVDCGSPWSCNAVTRLAVHEGQLYAGVSRLRGGGSGLPDSSNQEPGGRVLRYDGGTDWTDLGRLGDADSIAAARAVGRRPLRHPDVLRGPVPARVAGHVGLVRISGPASSGLGRPRRRAVRGRATITRTSSRRSPRPRRESSCPRDPRRAVAASSGTTAARPGRPSGCSQQRRRCTRSRRSTARCTSARGPRGSCTGTVARIAGNRSGGSGTRPRS